MKSWKTTAAGVGGLMTTIGSVLNQLFDGNPATNPDWNLVLPIIFTSLIGIFARDNGVSSEQVGADENTKMLKKFSAGPVPMILLTGLLAFGAMTTLSGCATTTPQTREAVVFNAYRDAWTICHSAYQAHCENVVRGKVSKEKEARVDAAWNKFRVVFNTAVRLSNQDWRQLPPASVEVAEMELLKLIRSL
jgi:hypothetical protein